MGSNKYGNLTKFKCEYSIKTDDIFFSPEYRTFIAHEITNKQQITSITNLNQRIFITSTEKGCVCSGSGAPLRRSKTGPKSEKRYLRSLFSIEKSNHRLIII